MQNFLNNPLFHAFAGHFKRNLRLPIPINFISVYFRIWRHNALETHIIVIANTAIHKQSGVPHDYWSESNVIYINYCRIIIGIYFHYYPTI